MDLSFYRYCYVRIASLKECLPAGRFLFCKGGTRTKRGQQTNSHSPTQAITYVSLLRQVVSSRGSALLLFSLFRGLIRTLHRPLCLMTTMMRSHLLSPLLPRKCHLRFCFPREWYHPNLHSCILCVSRSNQVRFAQDTVGLFRLRGLLFFLVFGYRLSLDSNHGICLDRGYFGSFSLAISK